MPKLVLTMTDTATVHLVLVLTVFDHSREIPNSKFSHLAVLSFYDSGPPVTRHSSLSTDRFDRGLRTRQETQDRGNYLER